MIWTYPSSTPRERENAQAHEAKNKAHDPIQDLGGSMTKGKLRKTQEAL